MNIFTQVFRQLSVIFLAIFLFSSLTTLSQNNMNPESPKPPGIPSPSGFADSESSVESSVSSVSSNFSSSFSNSIFTSNSVLISSASSSNFSNSSPSPSANSISSLILPADIAQDNTVRTGGFSNFLVFIMFLVGIFGFRYYHLTKQNRGLKTNEKKLKK